MDDRLLRTCLKVQAWPEGDRALWQKVTTFENILDDDVLRAALWREPTRERVRRGYGRWLSFLTASKTLDRTEAPAERITRERVKTYVTLLQEQVAPWTVWSYTLSLWCAARAFAPDGDWEWLYRIVAKLQVQRRPSKNKRVRMRPAAEIATWALGELDQLNDGPAQGEREALSYRNILMVAVLVFCPVRLRNLTMIRISKHLELRGDHYTLHYEPQEIKTDRFLSLRLPAELTPYVQAWLSNWRRLLLKEPGVDAFWVSLHGEPLYERGIYAAVTRTTRQAFGASINPHLFRDIAASWVIDMTPANVGIAGTILGHVNPATTEEHYIHANQAIAGQRYRSSVQSLRRSLAESYGNPFKERRHP